MRYILITRQVIQIIPVHRRHSRTLLIHLHPTLILRIVNYHLAVVEDHRLHLVFQLLQDRHLRTRIQLRPIRMLSMLIIRTRPYSRHPFLLPLQCRALHPANHN